VSGTVRRRLLQQRPVDGWYLVELIAGADPLYLRDAPHVLPGALVAIHFT
jgi:hypothetical protein